MTEVTVNNKRYNVEVAYTEEEKEQGLMNVDDLQEDEGMLFIYDAPQEVAFWMKNTPIPLDIIFLDEDGEVISVTTGKPDDETPITETGVSYVLEVNANSGISSGDDVDLSDLDEEYEEEDEEEDIQEDKRGGEIGKETPKMHVLAENGDTQMELDGGERIFSRKNTRVLISYAKKAVKSKKDIDYKKLGKKVFQFIHTQDTQKQEYTSI